MVLVVLGLGCDIGGFYDLGGYLCYCFVFVDYLFYFGGDMGVWVDVLDV